MSIDLFEPIRINSLQLRNRFVRSATGDGTADESGMVTDRSVAIYEKLGKGGSGLIVTGHAFVSPAGQSSLTQYGIYDDTMIPGLRRLVEIVHQGGAKIAIQISHAGIRSKYALQEGMVMQAVSCVPEIPGMYRVMTDQNIKEVISKFVSASQRAVEAGFDAIQLHGAHGYLISQFLSPLYNNRNDCWGGSPRKRRAFPLEVIRSVRKAIGFNFPLLIKLGVRDEKGGGLTLEEGLETAEALVTQGIDAIEVSCGFETAIKTAHPDEPERAYFRNMAAAIKRVVAVPVIAVGGIRSLKMARDIVDSGDADLISMCRPFICEPSLITRWQKGFEAPSTCISCNNCLTILRASRPMECIKNQKER